MSPFGSNKTFILISLYVVLKISNYRKIEDLCLKMSKYII